MCHLEQDIVKVDPTDCDEVIVSILRITEDFQKQVSMFFEAQSMLNLDSTTEEQVRQSCEALSTTYCNIAFHYD